MTERRGTKALELWCRRMTENYEGVKIDNMTTSWKDGLAFCALIHHFRPDLIEFEKLKKGDVYVNNKLAFSTAETYLGIPALLDADDMAAYEVPDRLSILTYLSQFYQMFSSQQDNLKRRKRTTSTDVQTDINQTASPPAKMAYVVGVPKRDPCGKCQLPVFLAERLIIDKKIYHRTCLKCARCGNQLTPGSFYETEVDNEYCCETCPDEEILNETKVKKTQDLTSSISDRVKFFEQNTIANVNSQVKEKVSEENQPEVLKEEIISTKYKLPPALSIFLNESLVEDINDVGLINDAKLIDKSNQEEIKMDTTVIKNEEFNDKEILTEQLIKSESNENSEVMPIPQEDIQSTEMPNENTFSNREKLVLSKLEISLNYNNENVLNSKNIESDNAENMNDNISEYSSQLEVDDSQMRTESQNSTSPIYTDTDGIATLNDKFLDGTVLIEKHSTSNISINLEFPIANSKENISNKSETNISAESLNDVPLETVTTGNIDDTENKKCITLTIKNDEPDLLIEEDLESKNDLKNPKNIKIKNYPDNLNPFSSDDEMDSETTESTKSFGKKKENLNPFDSSDDEIELEKSESSIASSKSNTKAKPPRPPPPRLSNSAIPEDMKDESLSFSASLTKRTPVPTPRTYLSESYNSTPEVTPRMSKRSSLAVSEGFNEHYGSVNSLSATPQHFHRTSDIRGSNHSINSFGGTMRSRKNRKAPTPPAKELFPYGENVDDSKVQTPSSSVAHTPKLSQKKRPAPPPPKPTRLEADKTRTIDSESKNGLGYPLENDLESKIFDDDENFSKGNTSTVRSSDESIDEKQHVRRLIPLHSSLLEDQNNGENSDLPGIDIDPLLDNLNSQLTIIERDRQLEKYKDNKEAQNRNRQSQFSMSSGAEDTENSILYNKSSHGKWKRRKGPAPALPVPPKKVLQMLPLQEIRFEMQIIEVQQQGLEKQGVILEKMIRDRCEGQNDEYLNIINEKNQQDFENPKEVEDLILQLFELVNEKNELFRRQAELMYLRRQHRLEQEQADLEYEIRVLMAQPECNKTDADKSREEQLIARLVEVVKLRNEVVDCLEMDRLREVEEDISIKKSLEEHSSKREGHVKSRKTSIKLSKKEKKKLKELRKLGKSAKMDVDKDADETEINADTQCTKDKHKNKKNIFFKSINAINSAFN